MEARLSIVLRAALVAAAAFTVAASNPPSGDGATAARFDSAIARAKADMLVDPRRTLEDTRAAGWIAATVPAGAARDRMDATVLWLTGEAYARDNQAVRALPLLMEARAKAGSVAVGSQLQADILLSQGSALIDANRITEALPTLQRAHELFRQLGQPRSQAKALILIALLYDGAQDRESALRYFSRAIDAYAADPGLSMSIYIGRGNTLLGLGRLTQAENDFGRAEALAYKIGSIGTAAIALGNLAHVRLEQGHLDAADAAIARGLALSRRSEAALTHDVFVELAARSAFEHGQLSRAEALITQRFRGIDLTRTILTDRSAHEAAYRIYAALGDTPHALAHLAALKRLDDQATAVARSNTAALASAQFDYANQELRIAKLKADDLQKNIAFERAAARTQLYIFVGAALATALVIALLAFGLFTIRRSRDKVRAANADLADSNVALEKALAAKTEFLATTSHEIRTPLNGILGMTQVMIADGALDAATRDRLAVVHGAGVTMRALVDDILDVAKIETGKMTIETARLDLAATIEDACRMWREQARGKGLAFGIDLDACPRWIMGDAARLRQIVFNLLSNAVKFTAAGHVTLAVVPGERRFTVTVADTGIGIAPDAHEVIFESFRQADAGTTRQFGGTGLGLSICRNLSRAMDGDVTVASTLGHGAVFTLDLPLIPAAPSEEASSELALLLVERNPINRAMFKSLFAAHGEIAFAAHLDEAVAVLARQRPRWVLADEATVQACGEPDGVLGRIVQAAGEAPVALLAAAMAADMRVRLLGAGVADVIERPIGKKALVERVLALGSALVREAA